MLAHNLKEILTIVPEASSLIKQASIEDEFPVNNKSSAAASRLRIEYLTKVASEGVDLEDLERVNRACNMYGLNEDLAPMLSKIASYNEEYLTKQAYSESDEMLEALSEFERQALRNEPLEKLASMANDIYERFGETGGNELLEKYACIGKLDKQTAIECMELRYSDTGNSMFTKLASAIEHIDADTMNRDQLVKMASMITEFDNKVSEGYSDFDFYRSCIIKEAAYEYSVTLAGKEVPFTSIQKLGKDRIGQILGNDVSSAMTGDPVNDKQVLATLPLDLQRLLVKYL